MLAPIDDYLLFAPRNGLANRSESLTRICASGADAVLTYAGSIQTYPELFANLPTIVNLTASTTLGEHVKKHAVYGVETALRLHACMVAVHVNLGGPDEGQMMEIAGKVIE